LIVVAVSLFMSDAKAAFTLSEAAAAVILSEAKDLRSGS